MPPILFLWMMAAVPQRVEVRYSDPELVAAARLPVPPVVMTRAEADALTDAALAERLIGYMPHGPITAVTRQPSDPAPMTPSANALRFVSFAEAGVPLRARLCRGRDIQVTFDTGDGGREPANLALRAEDRPRRVFWVHQTPSIGVVRRASPWACADARLAQVPAGQEAASAALVEQLIATAAGAHTGLALRSCFDRFAAATRCDPLKTLQALDWSQMGTIDRTAFTGEPVRWSMAVGRGDRSWKVIVEEERGGSQVALMRDYPAPF